MRIWRLLDRPARAWFLLSALIVFGLFQIGFDEGYDRPTNVMIRFFQKHWPDRPVKATVGGLVDGMRRHYNKGTEEFLYLQYANLFLGQPVDMDGFSRYRGDLGTHTALFLPNGVPQGPLLPYRDLALEYPPVNLPFIIAPRLLVSQPFDYYTVYAVEMGVLVMVTLVLGLWTAREVVKLSPQELSRWLALCSLGLLGLGQVFTTRLDMILCLSLLLAVVSALRRSPGWSGFWLAMACGAKLLPILLIPLFLCHLKSQQRGRFLLVWMLATAAIFVPAAVLGQERFWAMFWFHGSRPLQVESTYSGLLLLLDSGSKVGHFQGSFNLITPYVGPLKLFSTLATLVSGPLVALLYHGARQGQPERADALFLRSVVGSLCLLMVVAKVLSPQYLMWLWPLGFLIWDRDRRLVHGLVLACMVTTQLVFPAYYASLVFQGGWKGLTALLLRNSLLIILTVILLRGLFKTGQGATGGRSPAEVG